jgi:hypothetical protein
MMNPIVHMKLLVTLAQVDGSVADKEKNYIINIGRANGIYPDQVIPLFDKQHELIIPDDLSNDEKFDCIYSLVQLMKIDERMYQEEIRFCSYIATRLGYDHDVMFELMLHVKGTAMDKHEVANLKEVTQRFLKT